MKILTALAAVAMPVTLAAGLAIAPAGAASSSGLAVGDEVGKTEAEVRSMLEAAGSTIREIETEGGRIEAEFAVNGARFEIKVDRETGRVTKVESYERGKLSGDRDDKYDDDKDK